MNWNLICGNAIAELPRLEAGSVQCVVTSPPYWGLRKYEGNQDAVWGGDGECEHEWVEQKAYLAESNHGQGKSTIGYRADGSYSLGKEGSPYLNELAKRNKWAGINSTCLKCGAWKGAYGLEPTPEMYVEHTVLFLEEIKRVLRPDGVVFWSIGDSYSGSGKGIGSDHGKASFSDNNISKTKWGSLKPKDLCLIPFRVAIAAQEADWWVRSVIIWSKPNPMPESVKDRPTDAHEYILMLTKSRKYYWDIDSVREPYSEIQRWGGPVIERAIKGDGRPESAGLDRKREHQPNSGRNIRTVWQFPTQPYPEAHFAVFPEELPRRCILAATRERDTVLDPFSGAGTTLLVSENLNRKSIGIELSPTYCALATKRLLGIKDKKQ